MASSRMIDFLLALPLSVYNFNEQIYDRRLLFNGLAPNLPVDKYAVEDSKYSVVCAFSPERGMPAYLVSFCCPALETYGYGAEIFTVQIRKDYWGRFPPVDWFSLVVDAAQRRKSFEYP